ncbi:hypothetical protein G7Y79_00082g100820 [Physcia stellaris]|nr:hypothetical protein G7Y79_00082g100820 [Physcia stellaris]
MLSFLAPRLSKTPTATQNPLRTEDSQNAFHFFAADPSVEFAMKAHIKPGPTIHVPPYHWHKYQTETFLIHSGTMRATQEGSDKIIPAGQSITVEPGLYHTFYNNSMTENLSFSTGLDPMERERDEAFFRNIYSYLDDCRKAGKSPHIAQLMLFLYFFDCYPALPGPKSLSRPLSQVLVFVVGIMVGKLLLGFKESYPEYYQRKVE